MQVLGEPRRRGARGPLELIGVSGEVTPGVQLQPLGGARSVEGFKARSVGQTVSASPTTISSGVGPMRSIKDPGSYSE